MYVRYKFIHGSSWFRWPRWSCRPLGCVCACVAAQFIQFIAEANKQGCQPKSGVIRKIYKQNMKTVVKDLADFEDGEKYLCCGPEKPQDDADHIPAAFLE